MNARLVGLAGVDDAVDELVAQLGREPRLVEEHRRRTRDFYGLRNEEAAAREPGRPTDRAGSSAGEATPARSCPDDIDPAAEPRVSMRRPDRLSRLRFFDHAAPRKVLNHQSQDFAERHFE